MTTHKPTTPVRMYNSSDVDMLTVAANIIANAMDNKEEMLSKRPSWKDP